MQYMITPSGAEKSLNSGEIEMDVVQKRSILESKTKVLSKEWKRSIWKSRTKDRHKGNLVRWWCQYWRQAKGKSTKELWKKQWSHPQAMTTSMNPAKEPEQELRGNSVKSRPNNINATHQRSRHRKWDDLSNGYSRDWKIACWWKWSIQPTGRRLHVPLCLPPRRVTDTHVMYGPRETVLFSRESPRE